MWDATGNADELRLSQTHGGMTANDASRITH
jgi:hypothetical protein